jgi:predicted DNA-binding WGR domain protein
VNCHVVYSEGRPTTNLATFILFNTLKRVDRNVSGERKRHAVIKLIRSKPSSNLHRFYVLHLAPTLFGEWGLIAEWGRIGSPGTVREQLFQTQGSAEAALTKRVRIKTRRGYIRASWETA